MSHLQIASDAPLLIRAAGASVLGLHIGGGAVGLASGAVAMVARKGSRPHRVAGNVFFAAMLTMAGIGAVVSPMLNDIGSAFAGVMTFYLVLTGWLAVRGKAETGGKVEIVGVAVLACAMAVVGALGVKALGTPTRSLAGVPAYAYFVLVTISGLIAAVDLKVILGPALTGTQKLRRHLWRMCLALGVAYMSALAQPVIVPKFLAGSPVQFIPVAALLAAVIWWLVRLRARRIPLAKIRKAAPAAILETAS